MHYGKTFFTSNGKETITPLKPNVKIGNREQLSDIDKQELNIYFKCGG